MSAGEPCVQRVLRSLRDPAVGRITLYGLGGIGKTWVARHAADRAEQGSLFDLIIWVGLSASCSLRQVQQMILEKLPMVPAVPDGGDDGDNNTDREEGARGQEVRVALSAGSTKFLLILDDLWLTEDDVLGMIGVPAHDPAVGSKVLVTTRSRRVLATTQPHLLVEVAGLPFRESLELFLDATGEAADRFLSLLSLVYEVIRMCLGIPLAIILLGKALRGGNAGAPALESSLLEASSVLGHGTCNKLVYSAVKLSYRWLPDDAAREFLLKWALVDQRAANIATQDLIWYFSSSWNGHAEGTVVDDALEKAQALLTELLNRCLLQEAGDGGITVPKVVREVLLDIGRDNKFEIYWRAGPDIMWSPGERVWERYGLIALIDTMVETLPESPGCPRLSTLLLNGNHLLARIPERFFAVMPLLRVLDLSDTQIGHLPPSFRELSELRILLLRRCVWLVEVTNINSPKLEVLDLAGATRLRSISWGSSSSPPTHSLTVLNLSETAIEELRFLDSLRNLRRLLLSGCLCLRSTAQLSSLANMELLDLSGTMLVEFPYAISRLTQLKHLRLAGSKYTRVEWRMIDWLPEGLTWDQSSGSDITIEPVQSGGDATAFISVNDPMVFWTLDGDSALWQNCFKKFQFFLCHPDAAGHVRFQKKGFVFRDAYFSTRHFAQSCTERRRDRYLQICGVDCFPHGLEGVLCNSELVALTNLKFMKRLSDLGLTEMRGVKECWIEGCDQMETILDGEEAEFLGAEGSLGWLWVSNMVSLRTCLAGKTAGRAAGSLLA